MEKYIFQKISGDQHKLSRFFSRFEGTRGERNQIFCSADCFQSDPFQSDSATLNQIQSVIETSAACTQKWAFNCISAPLKQPVSLHTHSPSQSAP